ncbi:ComEA family DNA-binding protein [Peptoniphilus harei]|uniref:ComE operon protein 1 n=1 Tax=Peptoniphilus harei TaxID=54005 RepID=A0A2X1Y1U0_9FIRM|nr:ComEA family DNA-binding protein [Peptoniphilus harei]MBS6535277.1 ComEA family DNA-binding protein [Peptoniphilus harei]MDU2374096.1 ComEA family DNA-binding protein [Peptoniphilus harei]MDU5470518.1 ComEA family DNA-binding protein [Peptoniphilus harei]MDU6098295.1 ComEA family DNA-binding protein [Peptoniphilus harei]MDU6742827.1 ComEA family DNA-binding protein [Peptoniphilus harei]
MDFKFLNKDKLPYLIIVFLLLIIGYQYYDNHSKDDAKEFLKINTAGIIDNKKKSLDENTKELEIEKAPEESEEIMVHISGAVNSPGILRLDSSKRVVDALDLAGGARDDADLDRVNLAARLHDEEKIYIPKVGEVQENMTTLVSSPSSSGPASKININSADLSELTKIPGVGEKTAQKILDYRANNSFSSIEDIKNVPGIGDKKFESMKDYISTY